ncbi:MAG TPA: ferritin-like domain-containing protein [Candidatus Binatia bacterium]
MLPRARQSDSQEWFRREDELSTAVLDVLGECYVRESQHAMRYRQHAERIHCSEFRQELLRIAVEEQKHAESVGVQIQTLGGRIPEVIPVHVAKEQNLWQYLRTDLQEEERCAEELKDDLFLPLAKLPEIVRLLNQIDGDCKSHQRRIRAMLADVNPLSAGPP